MLSLSLSLSLSLFPTASTTTVRSYGTEDRKVEKYLAPKETLYEYSIFKANDIKELVIDEPHNDPAIVTVSIDAIRLVPPFRLANCSAISHWFELLCVIVTNL